MVALIPARARSKRCPGKNMRLLAGQPLIAYTVAAAQRSGVFEDIQVWSDDPAVLAWCQDMGVRAFQREPSADDEPDIAWVRIWAEQTIAKAFAILRPTSPFRTAATIQRAFAQFGEHCESLRAVERWDGPHPGKMWTYDPVSLQLTPVMSKWTDRAPFHSSPTQLLPAVVRQNASLEMAWTRNIHAAIPTIAGDEIAAFFTEGFEGFDINAEEDFDYATVLAARHPDLLPRIEVPA